MKWKPIADFDGYEMETYLVVDDGVYFLAYYSHGEWHTEYGVDDAAGSKLIFPQWFMELPKTPDAPYDRRDVLVELRATVEQLDNLVHRLECDGEK